MSLLTDSEQRLLLGNTTTRTELKAIRKKVEQIPAEIERLRVEQKKLHDAAVAEHSKKKEDENILKRVAMMYVSLKGWDKK